MLTNEAVRELFKVVFILLLAFGNKLVVDGRHLGVHLPNMHVHLAYTVKQRWSKDHRVSSNLHV